MNPEILAENREKIDLINEKLTDLLVERMKLVDQIAEWKNLNSQPVTVPEREEYILQQVRKRAGTKYAEDVEKVFRVLLNISCARETEKIGGEENKQVISQTL